MSLTIVEDREVFTFSDALELKIWLEAFAESELSSLPLLHGENQHLTIEYETEVFSNGERVKNVRIAGPEAKPEPKPARPLKACKNCGSTEILFDACTDQNGELRTVYDHSTCGGCEMDCPELVEVVK